MPSQGPLYIASAVDGTGNWANPANAEGVADGLTADLTLSSGNDPDAPTMLAFGHKLFRSSWALLYRIKGVPAQSAGTGQYPTSVMQSPEPLLGQLP